MPKEGFKNKKKVAQRVANPGLKPSPPDFEAQAPTSPPWHGPPSVWLVIPHVMAKVTLLPGILSDHLGSVLYYLPPITVSVNCLVYLSTNTTRQSEL